jgi:hypothetical protein
MRRITLALCFILLSGAAQAEATDAFSALAGQWTGAGTVNFSDNSQERLRCRAAYDVLRGGDQVQLSIRCASASYNFDLLGNARDNDGRITGSWNEESMNVAGQLAGVARGNRIEVTARSAGFTATLGLVTHDRRQSVSIRSQDPASKLRGATITLTRR